MPLLGLNLRTRPRPALLLTALMSVHSVGFVNTAFAGDSPRSAASLGAVELSSCNITGVAQPARCGTLDVPENPDRPVGRHLRIGVRGGEARGFGTAACPPAPRPPFKTS
jgi:hypothetical protein